MIAVDGRRFTASLRRIESSLQAVVEDALRRAAAHAAQNARATTSFRDRTGHLRRSIARGERGRFATFVQASAPYAGFVEFGTRHMAPRRFMRRAKDDGEAVLVRFIELGIGRLLA